MAQPLNAGLTTQAADALLALIKKQDFYKKVKQQPNYAVGLTEGDSLIISKVGGVTSKTAGMPALRQKIGTQAWYPAGTAVYLAQAFTGDKASNHAEMCVLAAAEALEERLTYIICSGDNCGACYRTLHAFKVATGNNAASGSQIAWVHPRAPMALGTTYNNDWATQLDELDGFNQAMVIGKWKGFKHEKTKRLISSPKGRFEALLR